MTKSEYETRLREIDQLAGEMAELERRRREQVKQSAGDLFGELDRQLADISSRIQSLRSLPQPNELIEVVMEGEAVLGDDTTLGRARAIALNNARMRAIGKAAGFAVHGSTILYNAKFLSHVVRLAANGIIVKEDIEDQGTRQREGQVLAYARIRAQVKRVAAYKRGNFKILSTEVYRAGAARPPKEPLFQHDDELQLRLRVNEDAFIHIFSVAQDGGLTKIYPNRFTGGRLLAAETVLLVPDEALRNLGMSLRARSPRTGKFVESVLFVATKRKVNFLVGKGSDRLTIIDLMQELAELEPAEWAEKSIDYEVAR